MIQPHGCRGAIAPRSFQVGTFAAVDVYTTSGRARTDDLERYPSNILELPVGCMYR